MRYFHLVSAIILAGFSTRAQETKQIIKTIPDGRNETTTDRAGFLANSQFTEKFSVLKADKKVRQGPYVKYRETFAGARIVESGSYKNGAKDGLWTVFFDSPWGMAANQIKEEGYYTNGRKNGPWKYFYAELSQKDVSQSGAEPLGNKAIERVGDQGVRMIGVFEDGRRTGEWRAFTPSGELFQKIDFSNGNLILDGSLKDSSEYITNRRALFIGGLPSLMDFLQDEFHLTKESLSKMSSDSSSVLVSFVITPNGLVSDSRIEKSFGYANFMEKEAKRVIRLSNEIWLPAIANAQRTISNYRILFFIVRKGTYESKRFRIGFLPVFD